MGFINANLFIDFKVVFNIVVEIAEFEIMVDTVTNTKVFINFVVNEYVVFVKNVVIKENLTKVENVI